MAWWAYKPSVEAMAKDVRWKFPAENDATTIAIVNIWSGKSARIGQKDYRLEQRNEGIQFKYAL